MRVSAESKFLEYCGRIDFTDKKEPLFVFPCSYVKIRFKGSSIKAVIKNRHSYWDNFLGVICDGAEKKICIYDQKNPAADDEEQTVILAENLPDEEHELMLFKRQDACHIFRFLGFEIEGGIGKCEILKTATRPKRRIEVYGDSVSAGEVSEALDFVGKKDPEWHQGEFSNSYYSYAWILARKLNASIHDVAQGGIALCNDTGWHLVNDGKKEYYMGMEDAYDKIQYNPGLGEVTNWDFDRYRPHVVIVALGQNDSHPVDYMKEDYNCDRAVKWRKKYFDFVKKLREIYPESEIILATTILEHDAGWDKSIEEITEKLQDKKVHHFLYSSNGCGTPGHIRKPEAEKMADELAAFIESLGEDIWKDENERFNLDYNAGIVNRGNTARLKNVMRRAIDGEKIVLGFFGGSITRGYASSAPDKCYAYNVYRWWKQKFPQTEFVYINAGIGGTTSQFGVARVEADLLCHNPDFVITEFSVNDKSTDHFMETYEGLIRKVYTYKTNPAVLIVHNVYYDDGANAQRVHAKIGRHYNIPCVSMQSTIYSKILSGELENRQITPDDLHPNDTGHKMVAAVIEHFLDMIYKNIDEAEMEGKFPEALTDNSYGNCIRYRNMDVTPKLCGFDIDKTKQTDMTDCFKNGWYAKDDGASFEMEFEGTGIALQYRRYADKTAPKARVVIDDDRNNAIVLDGKFDMDWGDNLELTTIAEKIENKKHTIKVTLEDAKGCEAPFYLVSAIVTK